LQTLKKESELTVDEKCAFDALVTLEQVPNLKVLEYIFFDLDEKTGIAITYTDERGVSRFQSKMYNSHDLMILSRKLKLKKLKNG
jgi:hypothetical protein